MANKVMNIDGNTFDLEQRERSTATHRVRIDRKRVFLFSGNTIRSRERRRMIMNVVQNDRMEAEKISIDEISLRFGYSCGGGMQQTNQMMLNVTRTIQLSAGECDANGSISKHAITTHSRCAMLAGSSRTSIKLSDSC